MVSWPAFLCRQSFRVPDFLQCEQQVLRVESLPERSFFQSRVNVIPGVPAEVDDIEVVAPPEILEPNANAVVEPDLDPGERSSVAAEIREVAPDISR